jgi:hypothetical protein
MTEQYYRSPIDKLVIESGLKAKLIADKMGIKYHRMVALRRLKDVKEVEIKLCEEAIADIKADKLPRKSPGKPKVAKVETKPIKPKIETVIANRGELMAFILGEAMALINRIAVDSEHDAIVERLNKLCNKLFISSR